MESVPMLCTGTALGNPSKNNVWKISHCLRSDPLHLPLWAKVWEIYELFCFPKKVEKNMV